MSDPPIQLVQEVELSVSRVQQLSLNSSLRDLLRKEILDPNQVIEAHRTLIIGFINTYVNMLYRNEAWRFQWIYPEVLALMMKNDIIGIITQNSIEVPVFQNLNGQNHCFTCGYYPIQGVHQCQLQVLIRRE